MQIKIEKKFSLLEEIASELPTLNCLYQEENTSDWQLKVVWDFVYP